MRIFATLFLLVAASAIAQAPGTTLTNLADVFEIGYLVADLNGDGVADATRARFLLGADPTLEGVAAASEVAVRLGFETMALDLPIPRTLEPSEGGVAVAFGLEGIAEAGLQIDVSDLQPGDGLITLASTDGHDVVVLAGRDDAGTRRAASTFAGRLPHLWSPTAPTITDVTSEARAWLEEAGIEPVAIRVPRLEVAADRDALSALTLSVELDTRDAVRDARDALRELSSDDPSDRALSHDGVERVVVVVTAPGASETVELTQVSDTRDGGPIPARPGAAAKRALDLSNLYTPDGLLGDSDGNLIPDRIDAVLSPAGVFQETIELAARLGLESAGMSIPITRLPDEIDDPKDEPTLILIGAGPGSHPLLDELSQEGEMQKTPPLEPGEGLIRVVPDLFESKSALVITGDDDGTKRALEQVAERFPNLWARGDDRTTVDDVEMDAWRFFRGRSPAGQAAIALYKLDRLLARLEGKQLESLHLLVSLEAPEEGLETVLRSRLAAASASEIEIVLDDRDVQHAATIFEETVSIGSEVDELRRIFRERVLPQVRRDRTVSLEARLSEPAAVRRRLEGELRGELASKGLPEDAMDVRVLSAYKQGYSWLEEVVGPQLEGRDAASIDIQVARYAPPAEWSQQAMQSPIRWLHEVFPIDEVLARQLGLPHDSIRFEMAPEDAVPYQIVATGGDGTEIFRGSFAPKFVLRPYIDRFRDYEMVRVTTGWIHADVGDERVVDQRIATDAERFWDHFQGRVLPDIYDYVMERHEGNPRGDGKDAPYFGELRVDLSLSEPHELLGLDNELISSMDALHEDIYFTTIMFFRLLGRNARGEEITYPGRVLPVMRPKADGKAGEAKIRFTGFATSRPAVVLDYVETSGEKGTLRLDIPKVAMERPRAMGARVRAGREGLERLDLFVKVDTETDERDALVERTRAEQVDERILSAAQARAMVEGLAQLREAGLYRQALAYHGLNALRIAAGWNHLPNDETDVIASLPGNGTPPAFPDVTDYDSVTRERDGKAMVQWDTPIPPPEAYAILSDMARNDYARVYKVGESYLGQDVWAMDLMPPLASSHWSRYKATTYKPTIIYSARQHANEVSSTSHVLKFAENLLTTPEGRHKLDKVNVVIHPITNPDGAQLAYDLYRITPDLLLHAGYWASLGMDVTSGAREPMPLYPEANIRTQLWDLWLPDIFLNPHGYPSHQLVQLFSEYTGLVRRGRMTERNWSMNKGWFLPGFDYLDDPLYPHHKDAAFAIRGYITQAINGVDTIYEMNQRNYDRYFRYGGRFDTEVFKMPMVDEVMIHTAIKGARAPSPGSAEGMYNPKVTIWSGSTEAPDETAHGDWMKLVATAGLQWDNAILQYLLDGKHKVERKGSEFWRGVSWSLDRPRPPKPPEPHEPHEEEDDH